MFCLQISVNFIYNIIVWFYYIIMILNWNGGNNWKCQCFSKFSVFRIDYFSHFMLQNGLNLDLEQKSFHQISLKDPFKSVLQTYNVIHMKNRSHLGDIRGGEKNLTWSDLLKIITIYILYDCKILIITLYNYIHTSLYHKIMTRLTKTAMALIVRDPTRPVDNSGLAYILLNYFYVNEGVKRTSGT